MEWRHAQVNWIKLYNLGIIIRLENWIWFLCRLNGWCSINQLWKQLCRWLTIADIVRWKLVWRQRQYWCTMVLWVAVWIGGKVVRISSALVCRTGKTSELWICHMLKELIQSILHLPNWFRVHHSLDKLCSELGRGPLRSGMMRRKNSFRVPFASIGGRIVESLKEFGWFTRVIESQPSM